MLCIQFFARCLMWLLFIQPFLFNCCCLVLKLHNIFICRSLCRSTHFTLRVLHQCNHCSFVCVFPALTADKKFCYRGANCWGEKTAPAPVTVEECCKGMGGFWGLYDPTDVTMCEECPAYLQGNVTFSSDTVLGIIRKPPTLA